MSPLTPPPLLPAAAPLSSAGGIAVLTVSVLTGWDSPNCRPPLPVLPVRGHSVATKCLFFYFFIFSEHLIEANYP